MAYTFPIFSAYYAIFREQEGSLHTGTRRGNPDTQLSMASCVEWQESPSRGRQLQQDDPRGASTCG